MGPTLLFTHLKIILLQCFQFSVFSFQFQQNKFYLNTPLVCIWIAFLHAAFSFFYWYPHFMWDTLLSVGLVHCAQNPLPFWPTKLSQECVCQWVLCTVHGIHKPLFSTKLSLKMGLIVLFTHLKIILLQCFQFSVFSKISSIQTDP